MNTLVKTTERSGWRDDVRLKKRHEMYGINCPACDIDHILIEYDRAQPRALIEYKHEFFDEKLIASASIRALSNLGSAAGVPAMLVKYADDFSWFDVLPINHKAKLKLNSLGLSDDVTKGERFKSILLQEPEFIELLYNLRDRQVPPGLVQNLGVSM